VDLRPVDLRRLAAFGVTSWTSADLRARDLRRLVAFGQTQASSLGVIAPSCKMRGGGVDGRDISEGLTTRGRSFIRGLLVAHVPLSQHVLQCY
jgi:hypothetical protein